MQKNTNYIQCIRDRVSVRTYDNKYIEVELMQKINAFLNDINQEVHELMKFQIINNNELVSKQSIKLGTYGVIKGTNTFIAGTINNNPESAIELGYHLEKIVLYATGLGLGTCWLGGTYNRKDFESYITLRQDESLAVLIAFGYRKDKQSMIETTMRFLAKSNQRKPAFELFFEKDSEHSLDLSQIGDFAKVLEMVRIAPSASNKQPWRIIKSGSHYHFYLCRTPGYGIMNYDLQLNDIGIAKCHFELVAKELNLKGYWLKIEELNFISGWEYCFTWKISN